MGCDPLIKSRDSRNAACSRPFGHFPNVNQSIKDPYRATHGQGERRSRSQHCHRGQQPLRASNPFVNIRALPAHAQRTATRIPTGGATPCPSNSKHPATRRAATISENGALQSPIEHRRRQVTYRDKLHCQTTSSLVTSCIYKAKP